MHWTEPLLVPGDNNSAEGLSVSSVEKAFRSLIADQYNEYRGVLREFSLYFFSIYVLHKTTIIS